MHPPRRLLAALHRNEWKVDLTSCHLHLHFFRRQVAEVINAYTLKRDDRLATVLRHKQELRIHKLISMEAHFAVLANFFQSLMGNHSVSYSIWPTRSGVI